MAVLAPHRLPNSGGGSPPVVEDRDRGGGGRGWVELARTSGDIEAHLLTGRLSDCGIEWHTLTDRSAMGAFLYGGHDPHAPVAVLVRRLQLEEARIVLAEVAWSAPPASKEQPPLPGSFALAWWLAALALAIAFTVLGLVQMVERCERVGACDRISTAN